MNRRNDLTTVCLIILFCASVFVSCKKEPGDGGNASIRGKVYAKYYDKYFNNLLGEGYAPEKDIYIIYGDEPTFSDRTRTNYDGTYEFKYLRKGKYKIYVYSLDSTVITYSDYHAVSVEAEITKNKQTIEVPDLVIIDK
ncbi:MAG: hypothetical protein PHD97_09355 [Bacteroidales bacterium]|nr:hypothetical protein [Bacteroidales bacterium]